MKTPGITVRPLMLMASPRHLNEVFFDNVESAGGEPRVRGRQGLDSGEISPGLRAH